MIPRSLVPFDARPSELEPSQRRRPSALDERTLVPAGLAPTPLETKSSIPLNLPLESIAARFVVPRDVNPEAYTAQDVSALPPQPSDLVEGVKSTASKLADKAQETARGAASSLASSAEEKARALAEDRKREAAEQVDAAAKFADSIAAEVERALPPAGGYVRGVASGIHRFSAALKDSSVDELMDEARRFAQARPATVLAGALVAGFGLARFLKASADRREARMRGERSARRPERRVTTSGAPEPEYPSDVAAEGPAAPQRARMSAAPASGSSSDGR